MKIAILGAMEEEITPLLDFFQNYTTEELAKNMFYIVRYKQHEIIIAHSKIGKVNAALTATILIEHFKAQKLLFSGVAGAISQELKIKDLIYASKLTQHDLDITAFGHPHGYVPGGEVFVKTDDDLNKIAQEVAHEKNINLKEGIIATGDEFVCKNETKEWIANTFQADALEMEGAAVAVVCDALNVPFFVLRAISDAADMDAGFDFDTFLDESSKVSANFIISMIDKIIEQAND